MVVRGVFAPQEGKFLREKAFVFERLRNVFLLPAFLFAIDLPLGLLQKHAPGGRECDRLARCILGPRRGSVFTPPPLEALPFNSYQALRARGIKISRQSFNLLPRLKEVHENLDLLLEKYVFETHPELVFRSLSGEILPSKHSPEGFQRRLQILKESCLFQNLLDNLHSLARKFKKDLLDAYACLLAAQKIFLGKAQLIPEKPPKDPRGLLLAIWF